MIRPEEDIRYITRCGKITSRLTAIETYNGQSWFEGRIDGKEHRWGLSGEHDIAGYELVQQYNPTLPEKTKAATDRVCTGLTMIPFYSILRIGAIFVEGLRYGKDNWKKGVNDKEYQEERLEHAMLHLIKWKEGDRTEDHLAKVAWFCVTQMELERLEKENVNEC